MTNEPKIPLNVHSMRAAASQASALLRLLSNEDRLLLLCQLTQGEVCVNDLERLVDIQQPTLSQQLGVLRRKGLVRTRREGKHIYYQINDGPTLSLLAVLYQLFCQQCAVPESATDQDGTKT